MDRLLTAAAIVVLLQAPALADEPARNDFAFGADVAFVDTSGYSSFLEYSAGKLRYDAGSDGVTLTRAWFDSRYRVSDMLTATIAGAGYLDDAGGIVDLTEAYLEWRPLFDSANRYRIKAGAFYPRVSLENVDRGWTSPYSVTPSAINTWIGEEFRVFGAEVSVTRRPELLGGRHRLTVFAAVFGANDPAGTLLSWKGWSLHDRQSRFGDEIPLPPVPQLQPEGYFSAQAPYLAPFIETDDAPGFYFGAEWIAGQRFKMTAMHYDNEADPESYRDGQFGWTTIFNSMGAQAKLPGDVGLLVQWLGGSTVWGRFVGATRAVDADFDSHYVMLTRRFDRHRLSARHDRFQVIDNDGFPSDDNGETGEAWTISYAFEWTDYASVAAEWLEVATRRPAWEYFGFDDKNTETQVQLALRLRFAM